MLFFGLVSKEEWKNITSCNNGLCL